MTEIWNNSRRCGNISQNSGNGSCNPEPFKYFYEYNEYQIHQFLTRNSVYILTCPAIPLNILCIIVVSVIRPFNSSCLYMFILGWADLVCVLGRLMYDYVDIASSEIACKFHNYVRNSSLVYSNFVLVCFTLERLFVTSFPLKAPLVCTKRNAGISLVISLVLCLSLNIIYLTDSHVKYMNQSGSIAAKCTLSQFAGNRWIKVFELYHSLIPLSVVALSNIGIIYNLNKQRKKKNKLTNGAHHHVQTDPTRTLVVVSMVFILLHLPSAVFNLVVQDYPTPAELPYIDQHYMASMLLVGKLFYSIMCLQNGINFFMYILAGAKFRRSFLKILTSTCRRPVKARGLR